MIRYRHNIAQDIAQEIKEKMVARKSSAYLVYLSRGRVCLANRGTSYYDKAMADMEFSTKGASIIGFYNRNIEPEDLAGDIHVELEINGLLEPRP